MYEKNSLSHICFVFSILACLFFCSHSLLSQTVSPGTVTIGGMDISSKIASGTSYAGTREIRPDLRIASEQWTETLPSGTTKQNVKPPESEVYTYIVNARGQGRVDLSLNDSAISYDVGEFREQDVAPTSFTVNKKFTCYDREKCTVIRSYTSGYVADYYDTCISIENRGYKAEVKAGTEPLSATASVTPWEIDVVYGTERQVSQTLGFSGGWPPSVGVNAGWGETNTQKWGWKLRETANKANTATPLSGSFTVTLNDTNVSGSNSAVPVTGCVTCPNCKGSVNHEDDHVRRVLDSNNNSVLAICPLGAGGTSNGCGEKIYDCTPEETARQNAWHTERTCDNSRWGVCGVAFRHCQNSSCDKRPPLQRPNRGHSDGSVSQAPSGVSNPYSQSHNFEASLDPEPTPTMHVCGVHQSWQSGDHSAASCGISGHYNCDGSDHSLQASCTSTDSHGSSCTVTNFYACQSHTCQYPAPPPQTATCAAGHTYDPGSASDVARHETVRTCRRSRCGQTFTRCSKPMCLAGPWKCWAINTD